jgi:lipoprotein signal peptidase
LFCLLAVLGLVLDQSSKYGVFAWLYNDGDGGEHKVITDVFSFEANFATEDDPSVKRESGDHQFIPKVKKREPGGQLFSPLRTVGGNVLPKVNHGALWGIGGRNAKNEEGSDFNVVFAVISVAAAIAIVLWTLRAATARDRWLCVALGLILAGTLGNLYDRIVFHGVRDFLHWKLVPKFLMDDFPIFNVADSCLVIGAALLLIQAFFTEPPTPAPAQAATAAGATPCASTATQEAPVAEAAIK